VAIFRWSVVFLLLEQFSGWYIVMQPWLQPLTQTCYVLIGVAFAVLAYERTHHRE